MVAWQHGELAVGGEPEQRKQKKDGQGMSAASAGTWVEGSQVVVPLVLPGSRRLSPLLPGNTLAAADPVTAGSSLSGGTLVARRINQWPESPSR
jgi:hypothetical protein